MKKLLILPLLLLFACGPGDIPKAESTVSLGNPDLMQIPCASGFTRTTPHFCHVNNAATAEAWSITAGGCTVHTLTSVSTGVTQALLSIQTLINSSNVVNQKTIGTAIYLDGTCTSAKDSINLSTREFVAVVAGTNIYTDDMQYLFPVFNGNQIVTNSVFTNTGTGSNFTLTLVGYYD